MISSFSINFHLLSWKNKNMNKIELVKSIPYLRYFSKHLRTGILLGIDMEIKLMKKKDIIQDFKNVINNAGSCQSETETGYEKEVK